MEGVVKVVADGRIELGQSIAILVHIKKAVAYVPLTLLYGMETNKS